tara:strand:+ start:853 stop:1224 length:372 start_codon:yes stop_codon:yes gene_type:complete
MAVVNKVDIKLKVKIDKTIKFQILTYCFFEDITLSTSDLNCLSELAKLPNVEISKFCMHLTDKSIFKSPQSARNAINKINKKNLIIKKGKNKKTISVNDIVNLQTKGYVLLDYKILGSESKES